MNSLTSVVDMKAVMSEDGMEIRRRWDVAGTYLERKWNEYGTEMGRK